MLGLASGGDTVEAREGEGSQASTPLVESMTNGMNNDGTAGAMEDQDGKS